MFVTIFYISIDNNQIKKEFQVKKDFMTLIFKITSFKFKNKLKSVIFKKIIL